MKSIFTACFILVVQGLFAQDGSDLSVKNEPWSLSNADKILKFSPLDVLSYSPNLGADLEVSMKKTIHCKVDFPIIPILCNLCRMPTRMTTCLGIVQGSKRVITVQSVELAILPWAFHLSTYLFEMSFRLAWNVRKTKMET